MLRFILFSIIFAIQDWFDDFRDNRTTGALRKFRIRRVYLREKGLIKSVMSSIDESLKVYGHSGRCAIGALLVSLGVPDEDIAGRFYPTNDQHALIKNMFGIDGDLCDNIMGLNDNASYEPNALACGFNESGPGDSLANRRARVKLVNEFVMGLNPETGRPNAPVSAV